MYKRQVPNGSKESKIAKIQVPHDNEHQVKAQQQTKANAENDDVANVPPDSAARASARVPSPDGADAVATVAVRVDDLLRAFNYKQSSASSSSSRSGSAAMPSSNGSDAYTNALAFTALHHVLSPATMSLPPHVLRGLTTAPPDATVLVRVRVHVRRSESDSEAPSLSTSSVSSVLPSNPSITVNGAPRTA